MDSPGFFVVPKGAAIAYLNMPKAGCTSILRALAVMSHGSMPLPEERLSDGSDPVHGYGAVDGHLDYFAERWHVRDGDLPRRLFRFTFVRHPFTRFVSFYRSKIRDQQKPGEHYARFGLTAETTLERAVEVITSLPVEELEHHALPQSLIATQRGKPLIDFVGKLEDIRMHWPLIEKVSGYTVALSISNRSADRGVGEALDDNLRQRLYAYYRDDFKLFGYVADEQVALATPPGVQVAHLLPSEGALAVATALARSSSDVRAQPDDWRVADAEALELQLELSRRALAAHRRRTSDGLGKVERQRADLERMIRSEGEGTARMFADVRVSVDELAKDVARAHGTLRELRTDAASRARQGERALRAVQEQMSREADDVQQRLEKADHLIAQCSRDVRLVADRVDRLASRLEKQEERAKRRVLSAFAANSRSRWMRLVRRIRYRRVNELEVLERSGLVDPGYYFVHYPEAARIGVSAAEHYLRVGALKGYDPSDAFSTVQYLLHHPEAVLSGCNPLLHKYVERERPLRVRVGV